MKFLERPFIIRLKKYFCPRFSHGEMAERFNAAVLKTVVLKGTGGSNPSLSAQKRRVQVGRAFFIHGRRRRMKAATTRRFLE